MERNQQSPFRPLIEKRLEEIEAQLKESSENTAAIAPDKAIGRLSRLDSMQMQQMALAAKQRLQNERTRLIEARRRLDMGRYGSCLRCGQDIALERLEYQPDAIFCIRCAS